MNLRSDLEFTLDYAISDLAKIYEDKQNLIPLNERIKMVQNTINNLHVILGYGTASEPMASGELGALRHAIEGVQNPVVFDVGSHVGEYATMVRGHFPEVEIHSFEPDPQSFAKMNDNLVNRFGEGHGVITNNQAITKHNGVATLYTHQIGAANSSLAHRELSHLGAKFDLEQTVQTKTLRSYCDENNIEIIDYLKIDTEGTEYDIIESAMPMIEENRIRFIQFEYGSCNVDTRTYLKDFYLLLRHKYNFYRIHPEGLYPCNEYQEAYECFNLCNYVLERYA
jgi:FkbM family methyltransferase